MWNRGELARRHTSEWENYRKEIMTPALECQDEKQAKVAKVLADCIRLTQDGERRAYLFSAEQEQTEPVTYQWEEGE